MRQGRAVLLAALVVTGLLVGLGAVTAAEGDPTISLSGGSTAAGVGAVVVDDGLTVSGSGEIAGATVSFASGFDADVDRLAVDTSAAGSLADSYDTSSGVLTLSGSASPEEMQSVLRTVEYNYSGSADASAREVDVRFALGTDGTPVYLPATGHYYEYVSDSVSFDTARSEAENRSHLGLEGYLATLTSEQEDDAIHQQFVQEAWIGASDAETEGDWKWVTGPENGTLFWKGTEAGSAQNGEYAGWSDGEPNSRNANENYAEINLFSTGWNDQVENQGYLVEYGGLTADSAITAQRTVTVDTGAPNVSDVTIKRDGGGGVVTTGDTIEVSATVTDASSIQSVTASAIAFDAGTVTLSDDGPNSTAADVYSARFTVGANSSEGDQLVTVTATDAAGNGGTPPGNLVYDSITVNPGGTTDFRTVRLPRSFENPVVIAKPLESTSTRSNSVNVATEKRGHTRIRNVQSNSFEIRVEEWSNQQSGHPAANVSYIVAEAGTTALDGGTKIDAGTTTLKEGPIKSVAFNQTLSGTPIAFTQPQTFNDPDAVSTRNQKIDSDGLEVFIQEDEASGTDGNAHGEEKVGYIAIEAGDSELGETKLTAGKVSSVDNNLQTINFGSAFPAGFVADMQDSSGGQPAYLRYDNRKADSVDVRVEEDAAKDKDGHAATSVGYLAWDTNTAAGGTQSNTLSVDTTAPSFGAVSITRIGGKPPLSSGDEFEISAEVIDSGGIEEVTADVSALDAGTVDLTRSGDTYNGTVTVGAAPSTTRSVSITATDTLGQDATMTAIAGTQASWTHEVDGTDQTATYAGAGSAVDPYIIDSLVDLQAIDKDSTTLSHHYRLGTDIDAGATASWNDQAGFVPIGASDAFTGHLEGAGHSITGLHIDRDERYQGLFGRLDAGASVANLTLTAASVAGTDDVGLLAGESAGTITGVRVSGDVDGESSVGGLVGDNDGTVDEVHASGTVTASGNDVGGLIGHSDQGLANATAAVTVTSTAGSDVGGLIGELDADSYAPIINVSASGAVSADGKHVGGLIGMFEGSTIRDATASGTVESDSEGYVGGLIGYYKDRQAHGAALIQNVSARGDVDETHNYVGGLIGHSDQGLANATAAVTVTSAAGSDVGGLIGEFDADSYAPIINVSASGAVSADGQHVGGLIGMFEGSTIRNATASHRR